TDSMTPAIEGRIHNLIQQHVSPQDPEYTPLIAIFTRLQALSGQPLASKQQALTTLQEELTTLEQDYTTRKLKDRRRTKNTGVIKAVKSIRNQVQTLETLLNQLRGSHRNWFEPHVKNLRDRMQALATRLEAGYELVDDQLAYREFSD